MNLPSNESALSYSSDALLLHDRSRRTSSLTTSHHSYLQMSVGGSEELSACLPIGPSTWCGCQRASAEEIQVSVSKGQWRQMEDGNVQTSLSRIAFESVWGIFLPVIACGTNYCLAKRDGMQHIREINGLHAAGMEGWLPLYINDISDTLLKMSNHLTSDKMEKYLRIFHPCWIFQLFKTLDKLLNQAKFDWKLSLNCFLALTKLSKWWGLEPPLAMGACLISITVMDQCRGAVII